MKLSSDDRDRLLVVANTTLLVFIMIVGLVGYSASRPVITDSSPQPATAVEPEGAMDPETRRVTEMWNRVGATGSVVASGAAGLELPAIPDGRLAWTKKQEGRGYWGYVTPRTGTDVGIAALQYYADRPGWKVAFSEQMDTSGKGWTGVLVKPDERVVVGIFAIPESLSLPSRTTRVSVVRFDAKGVENLANIFMAAQTK